MDGRNVIESAGMRRPKKATKTLYYNAVMSMYGVSVVMIGTMIPEMIRRFDLSLSRGGLIVTVQSAGGIIALLAATLFADRINKRAAVAVSFGVLGLAWIGVGGAPIYAALLGAFFVSGAAIRVLDIMLNAHVADMHPDGRGFHLNRLHMYFSIGAFAGPMIARSLVDAGMGWNEVYLAIGAVFVVASIPGHRRERRAPAVKVHAEAGAEPAADATSTRQTSDQTTVLPPQPRLLLRSLLRRPESYVLGAVLFFYIVHQSGVTTWLPLYMEESLGTTPAAAGFALSLFWIGIIAGRFLSARLAARFGASRLIIIGGLAGGLLLTAGTLVADSRVLMAVGFAAGTLTGATIPLAMVIAYRLFPANTGSATALLSLFMMSGRLLGPWVMGLIAEARVTEQPMLPAMILTGAALTIAALCLAGGLRSGAIHSSGS